MPQFLDRRDELQTLTERFDGGRPELLVIYGRRRIGKSALLRELARDRLHLYYLATPRLPVAELLSDRGAPGAECAG